MIRTRNLQVLMLAACAALSLPASADTYTVDGMHSMPAFTFKHLNLSMFRGRFDKVSGTIVIDPAKHTGSAVIDIDIASVSTGVPMLDQFLKGPRFFDVAAFPSATFKGEQFQFDGEQLKAVAGTLTLHGVSKQVLLDVSFYACHPHPLLKVPACGADASVTITRSAFGLDAFIGNDSDDVRLDIAVEATKSP